ncbi:isochorismatase family protein [Lysinibacillus agricola]|uniref:isochorismatase family protein n=1 Tax=Lysinibacillus agricola TaxID=2590012 RepID=UPI003C1BA856
MRQTLLVLDIQNDYCSDQARMPVAKQIEPILNGINDLIKRAERLMIPIIYIRNEFE